MGIGCLSVIGIVVAGVFLAKSPAFKQAMGGVMDAQTSVKLLTSSKSFVDKYRAEKGKYPKSLADLVPKYASSMDSFKVGTGEKSAALEYEQPEEKAGSKTVIMTITTASPFPYKGAPPWKMGVRVDGKLVGTEYSYTQNGQSTKVRAPGYLGESISWDQ